MESTLSIFQFDDARTLCWTEENRLQGFLDCTVDGSLMACYVYDADGERCLKLTSPRMSVQQNGATLPTLPLNSPTFYPSPLITLTKKGYTKHYFEENRRICSKIGGGFGNVVWDSVTTQIPPINEDYYNNSDILLKGLRDLTGACLGVTPKFINLPDVYSMLYDHERLRNVSENAFYYHSDHLGSAAYLTNDNAQVSQTLNYLPYGEDWVDIHSNLDYRMGQYTFNGKEKDSESGFHYYGARYYWIETLTGWLSVDPMADKYPGVSPYAYCVWNPVKLVDPDGRKDRPFRNGDRRVHDIPGTETPIYGKTIGFMYVFSSYSILNAYNCHSYAWHGSWGDKKPASGDIPLDQYGITSLPRWDQNPADDIKDVLSRGGRQLGSDENNIVGDRVIYYTDQNENGIYDDGEFISHSAIVTSVDDEGYTVEVTGKRGEKGISTNHPDAPGYYKTVSDPNTGREEKQSRAYFRMPSEN